ncbi:MAG: nicotinate-nucleotide adenylyltransferase [Polynucleobacter sp.]|nr:MAG: nicotinate-nucleotide adenylyltransferase [Polynucleobacter sp.]
MDQKKRKSIGILGGTFDPPHWGHLRLAEHFSKVLQLDHIIWMPAGQPWQKGSNITPAKHRLAMSEYAIETLHDLFVDHHIYTKIEISTLEMSREGPSYAIDTAQELRALYGPDASITWLMGQDSWLNLKTWHKWSELPKYVHLAVASRPMDGLNPETGRLEGLFADKQTEDPQLLQLSPNGHVLFDQSLQINLASSDLRDGFYNHSSWDELADAIPPLVLEYIEAKGLYRNT